MDLVNLIQQGLCWCTKKNRSYQFTQSVCKYVANKEGFCLVGRFLFWFIFFSNPADTFLKL